jgi:hypothetical protein
MTPAEKAVWTMRAAAMGPRHFRAAAYAEEARDALTDGNARFSFADGAELAVWTKVVRYCAYGYF